MLNLPNASELDISPIMQILIIQQAQTQEESQFKAPSGFKNELQLTAGD